MALVKAKFAIKRHHNLKRRRNDDSGIFKTKTTTPITKKGDARVSPRPKPEAVIKTEIAKLRRFVKFYQNNLPDVARFILCLRKGSLFYFFRFYYQEDLVLFNNLIALMRQVDNFRSSPAIFNTMEKRLRQNKAAPNYVRGEVFLTFNQIELARIQRTVTNPEMFGAFYGLFKTKEL